MSSSERMQVTGALYPVDRKSVHEHKRNMHKHAQLLTKTALGVQFGFGAEADIFSQTKQNDFRLNSAMIYYIVRGNFTITYIDMLVTYVCIYLETRIFPLLFTLAGLLENVSVIMVSYHCHSQVYDECSTISCLCEYWNLLFNDDY